MKKGFWILFVGVFLLLWGSVSPVYAAYNYSIGVTVSSNGSTDYASLPVLVTLNTTQLYELGYIDADGLDTALLEGASDVDYMLSNDSMSMSLSELLAGQSKTFSLRLGDTVGQSSFPIIVGVNGSITVPDDASLEPGDNFEIEYSGYIDSSVAGDIVSKTDALSLTTDGEGKINADIYGVTTYTAGNYLSAQALSGALDNRFAQYLPSASGVFSCTLRLFTLNPITGTAYVRIWDATTGEIIDTLGTLDVSILTSSSTSYSFTSSVEINERDIYIGIEYTGGDSQWTLQVEYASNSESMPSTAQRYTSSGVWLNTQYDIRSSISFSSVNTSVSTVLFDVDIDTTYTSGEYAGAHQVSDAFDRFAQFLPSASGVFTCTLNLSISSPTTGTAYIRMWDAMTDEIIDTLGTLDVSILTSSSTSYSFTSSVEINERDIYIGIEYNGGTPLLVEYASNSESMPGEAFYYYSTYYVWLESGYDIRGSISYGSISPDSLSGEHTIKVTADTTYLKLFIDGEVKDTTTLSEVPISDNTNDWVLFAGGNTPYVNYYKHTVSGVLQAWYQPNSMLLTSSLPDRSGNGNNGEITWGTNPADITVTLGAITPVSNYVPPGSDSNGEPPVALPTPGEINLHGDPDVDLSHMPLYDSVSRASAAMGWTVQTSYAILMLIGSIAIGFAGILTTGTVWGFIIGFGSTSLVAGSTEAFPWWLTLICVLFAVFLAYVWRHT